MPPAHELTAPSPRVPALAVPRVAVRYRVALAVLALTALTFLVPSAPTYDPWAWIIWGREILHLDLSTVDGPSWKPLPVLLTTPFALFGSLAPDLWLFVARAGAIAGVVMAFRVARRLGGVPAGAAAAGAYVVAPWMLRNSALGNSEGLLVALGLAAFDRHLAGRPRQAFLFGLGAALLRPEAWPLLGLYGLWLLWREPAARRLVVAGFVALPALWLLPELWGSGDLLRAAHRAHNPRANSAAFAEDPVREVFRQFATMLTPALWIGLGTLAVMLVLRLGAGRRERRAVIVLALAAAVWVAEVAVMTNDGFSGNARYLIMPAAVACVLAGTGIGWLVRALPARWFGGALADRARLHRGRSGLRGAQRAAPGCGAGVRLLPGAAHRRPTRRHRAGRRSRPPEGMRHDLHRGLPGAVGGLVHGRAHDVRAVGKHARRSSRRRCPASSCARTDHRHSRFAVPGIEGLGGEEGVQTFAISGGWRIVGNCG